MLRKLLFDKRRDICDRTYVLFVLILIAVITAIMISNLISGRWHTVEFLDYLLTDAVFVALLIKSLRTGEITFEPMVASILFSVVSFPLLFISGTGYRAEVPIFMVAGFLFNAMVLKKKAKFVMNIIYTLIIALVYILAYSGVIITREDSLLEMNVKTVVGVAIAGIVIALMIVYQKIIYARELDQAKEQTEKIKKINEGQSKFFSSMSHEIRTPLNTIIGLNEINLSMDLTSDMLENFQGIRASSERLLELINDILDMSKIQSEKMEHVPMEFEIGKMLSEIAGKIYKRAVKRSIEFHAIIDPDIPEILVGDEPKIKRILEALLTYSVAMTEKGYVKLFVGFKKNGNGEIILDVEIEDTGAGVKRENIPYVFDMFSRQEGFYKNEDLLSGFELALSKSLTEIMGGGISIDSVYGKGSRLLVHLPMKIGSSTKTLGECGGKEDSTHDFSADTARVLVVDDEGMNLNVFTNLIKPLGISSDTATSGEEAVELVKENRYDIVFIDHMMPGMDGPHTLEAIKKTENPPKCTVALTANSGNAVRKEYLDMGFTGYLPKPVDRHECFELIEQLIPDKIKKKSTEEKSVSAEKIPIKFEKRNRVKIAITMDSVGDIPDTYPEKERIAVMPYYCVLGDDRRYKDVSEITIYPMIKAMNEKGHTLRSAPPSVDEYEKFFAERLSSAADQIIHLSMAKNSSDGYKNACIAAEGFNSVTVLDSGSVSAGMGIQAVYAHRMAEAGKSLDEIVEILKDIQNDFGFFFVINDTENLMKTGRISPFVHYLCKQLRLRPVIKLRNSKMRVAGLLRGSFEKSVNDFANKFLRNNVSNEELFILHAGLSRQDLKKLSESCQSVMTFDKVSESLTSAPITANSGAGAYGLLYFKRNHRFMLNS